MVGPTMTAPEQAAGPAADAAATVRRAIAEAVAVQRGLDIPKRP